MTQHSRKNVNRKVYQQKQQHKKGWEIVKIKKKPLMYTTIKHPKIRK